jgi:hypothetical protein
LTSSKKPGAPFEHTRIRTPLEVFIPSTDFSFPANSLAVKEHHLMLEEKKREDLALMQTQLEAARAEIEAQLSQSLAHAAAQVEAMRLEMLQFTTEAAVRVGTFKKILAS